MASLSADQKQIVVEFTDISAGLIVSGHNPADSYGMEVQGFSVGDYDHRTPARAVISSRHAVTVDIPEEVLAAVEANPGEAKALMGQVNYAYFVRVTPENADLRGGNNLPAPAFAMDVPGVYAYDERRSLLRVHQALERRHRILRCVAEFLAGNRGAAVGYPPVSCGLSGKCERCPTVSASVLP
jgi:hypothetical protein